MNRAIRDLIARRRINATSVMVGAPSFDAGEARALDAVAGENAGTRAAVGLHFTLTAPFRPLGAYRPIAADGAFLSLRQMLARGLARALDGRAAAAEAERQIEAFRPAFGRPPDFIDGHQHVHLLPQVGDALLAVMKERAPARLGQAMRADLAADETARPCQGPSARRAQPAHAQAVRDPRRRHQSGLCRRL